MFPLTNNRIYNRRTSTVNLSVRPYVVHFYQLARLAPVALLHSPVRIGSAEPVDGRLAQVAAYPAVNALEGVLAPNQVVLQDIKHFHHLKKSYLFEQRVKKGGQTIYEL